VLQYGKLYLQTARRGAAHMNSITSSIEKARSMRGLSQEQVARALGISRPTYVNIENGKKELTISQVRTLASVLNIGLDDILGTSGETLPLSDVITSSEKYKQIILNALKYGSDSDGKITKTKLAKLVYLSDFIWYYDNSAPMSGMTYRKLSRGPVADIYFRLLDELEESGTVVREPKGNAILFSLVEEEAPVNKLSNAELNLIKRVGNAWKGKATEEIVDFTHEQLPWQICRDGEVIPYNLITQEEPENVYGPVEL
jgi:transcriptional regulator with XRE-family HTH domain